MANLRACLATCAAALSLAIAPGLASAAMPTGSFEFQLGGANSLWMGSDVDTHEDADGFCASFGGGFDEVELCDYELTVDGRGKIGGWVEFAGRVDGIRIDIEGPIKGAQRGNNRTGITRAAFVIRLAGSATRNGFAWATSLSMKLVAQIDAGGVMQGTWTRKLCNEGAPCETTRWPAGPNTWTNGHWTLALDVEHRGAGELGGSARITFGDESFCDFAVYGSYDATKDAAGIALAPVSPHCAGGSLRLKSLIVPSRGPDPEIAWLLQFGLFGVRGTTIVGTHTVALFHPRAPLRPLPTSSGSGSSGAMATITIIQLPLPQPDPPQGAGVTLSASAELVNLNHVLESVIAAQPASETSGVMLTATLPQ